MNPSKFHLLEPDYTKPIFKISKSHSAKIKDKLNRILAKHTSQPLEKVEKDTDRNFYLSASESKEYGIIDEVIKTKE